MAWADIKRVVVEPLISNNPITVQILGICSALAVTASLKVTLVMCVALTLVTAFSGFGISSTRTHIPISIRIIVQMTITAPLVDVVEQILNALTHELGGPLALFVGSTIAKCAVTGRAEALVMQNGPALSFVDTRGDGL